jgi:hypothetical protein
MSKTLKALYYGNLALFDHPIPSGSPIRKLSAHLTQCETKLKERLDGEEKALLEDILKTQQDMDSVTAEENFILGFRLGVQLMAECLTGEGDD